MKNKLFITKKLKIISNIDGDIMLGLKKNDKQFLRFEELYFSKIIINKIKAWKIHKKATMNLLVPYGNIKFVIYDLKNNKFYSQILGENNYKLLTIYPGTIFGFKGLSRPFSILSNVSNYINDKNEYKKININEFKYDWKK